MMKMPLPCDLDVGFMIHMRLGDFLYSSTKRLKSLGRIKVVGMMSRSGIGAADEPAPPRTLPPIKPASFACFGSCRSIHVRSSSLR